MERKNWRGVPFPAKKLKAATDDLIENRNRDPESLKWHKNSKQFPRCYR